MENLYQIITSNPIYMIIAVIISILIVFSIIKKMIKLLIITAACLVIYVGYLQYTGQEIPENVNELIDSVKTDVNTGVKTITDKTNEIIKREFTKKADAIVDTIKEKSNTIDKENR
jgi:hypothetical protein